jgi:3-hydroxyacyl-CoA dehydrogenase
VIRKAAVLGAGTMGARIAAHLANAGLPVVLLDIPAKEGGRSAIASQALDALKKNKPAAFYDPAYAAHVSVGNFDDDLGLLADCDWVIEAVMENLGIKQSLLEKVVPHLKKDAILTTNTSGLPVASIAAKLPETVRRRFFGTHFFNPPRYMRLVEIIPTQYADPAAVGAISHFADLLLGKEVVFARDTPNFIANRIGLLSLTVRLMQRRPGPRRVDPPKRDWLAKDGTFNGRYGEYPMALARTEGRGDAAIRADSWSSGGWR